MTLFDYAVLAIAGFSVLLGVLRGFAREVIALGSWVVAFVAASAWGGDAAPLLARQIPDENWRVLAAVVAIFLVVLVAMNIVAMLASKLIKSAGLGVEDRLLGSVFGLARGVAVVVALVLAAGLTVLPRQPVWKDAMLAAPLEKLAVLVKQWLPQDWAKNISYATERG
jgi:membrane protein required for colicin V production